MDIFFCDICKNKVKAYGDIAFSLFEIICESYFNEHPLEISTDSHDGPYDFLQIIYFLESKGLVITTESSFSLIQVKPLGLHYYGGGMDFFAQFCIHTEKLRDYIDAKKKDVI